MSSVGYSGAGEEGKAKVGEFIARGNSMDKSKKLYTVDPVPSPKAAGKGGISSSVLADFLSGERKPDPYFTEILSKRSNHLRCGILRTVPCRNQGKPYNNFRGLLVAQRKKKHLEEFKDEFEAKCNVAAEEPGEE